MHRPETQAGGAGSTNNKVVVGIRYPGTRKHCGDLTIAHSGMGCDMISHILAPVGTAARIRT